MYGLSNDIAISILRHILTFIGGLIIAKGWVGADAMAQITGAIVSIVGVLYAAFFHATSNGAIATLSTTPNAAPKTSIATFPNADNILQ